MWVLEKLVDGECLQLVSELLMNLTEDIFAFYLYRTRLWDAKTVQAH